MAVQTQDSYDRCLTELKERYQYRGVSMNVKSEMLLQAKKEESTRAIAPEAYVLFDAGSKIADSYRSGDYQGSKYMTSNDFVRYFKTRRAFYMPEIVKEAMPAEAPAAMPERRRSGTAGQGTVKSESGKEGHLATALSAIKELKDKWLPVERKDGRTERTKFRFPAAAASGIAVFAVSLGLIVGGSVMLGNASGEVGELNSTIAALEAKQSDLQGKLDLKYNVDEIERDAKSLGMIKRQYADSEYLTVSGEEEIIVYEDGEDENMGLAALLASFGIDLH
ncbi:MAG: hypothetical protein E7668_05415 [Ruminococcaceae bacterium]|nr:hypothetical protein [Oscillospiraceae bacterium]